MSINASPHLLGMRVVLNRLSTMNLDVLNRGSQQFELPPVRTDFNRTIRIARPKTVRIAVKALLFFALR